MWNHPWQRRQRWRLGFLCHSAMKGCSAFQAHSVQKILAGAPKGETIVSMNFTFILKYNQYLCHYTKIVYSICKLIHHWIGLCKIIEVLQQEMTGGLAACTTWAVVSCPWSASNSGQPRQHRTKIVDWNTIMIYMMNETSLVELIPSGELT